MSTQTRHAKSSDGPVRLALVLGPGAMVRLGRTLKHLAIGLIDEPMTLTVVAPASEDLSTLPSPPLEILTYRPPKFGHWSRRKIDSLCDALAHRKVEVLHCIDSLAVGLTRRLSEHLDRPYFVSVQTLRGCRRLHPATEHCAGVIAASLALREAVLNEQITPDDQTHLIRTGVRPVEDVSCFEVRDHSTAIIAGGDLNDAIAFDRVLDSYAALRAAQYDCALFILGNGKAETHLRSRVKAMALAHDVTFVDRLPQDKLPGVFREADILVYPGSAGQLETEVLEAMAARTAILIGGEAVGDFAIDSQTVFSYNPNSTEDLTNKLRGLIDHPDEAVRIAAGAQEHLHANHSPASMVAALAQLYRNCALGGRAPKVRQPAGA